MGLQPLDQAGASVSLLSLKKEGARIYGVVRFAAGEKRYKSSSFYLISLLITTLSLTTMQLIRIFQSTLFLAFASVILAERQNDAIPFCKLCEPPKCNLAKDYQTPVAAFRRTTPLDGWLANYQGKNEIAVNFWEQAMPYMVLTDVKAGMAVANITFQKDQHQTSLVYQFKDGGECTIQDYPQGFKSKDVQGVKLFFKKNK